MKNKLLLSVILFAGFIYSAHATVRTVSNNYYSPGQYTSLVIAIDSAANGDTLYVEPSPTDYGSITINKLLYVFGGGSYPYTYQFNYSTKVDQVTFSPNTSYPVSSPNGSIFQGFLVGSGININANLKNITIARVLTSGSIAINAADSGIVIADNIINSTSLTITGGNQNDITALVSNNFFYNSSVQGYYYAAYSENGVTLLNNIFYGTSGTASNSNAYFTNNCDYLIVKNNIFYCEGASGAFSSGCSNCSFLNNITFSPNTTQTLPDGNNSGSGNINNTNPGFTAGPGTYVTLNAGALYNYNWNLTSASPGHLAGTDGTDIGIYGGAYPFVSFEALTKLPQVRLLNITNTAVQPNGTLNVNVIGTSHN